VVIRHERALAPFYTWGHPQIDSLYIAGKKQL